MDWSDDSIVVEIHGKKYAFSGEDESDGDQVCAAAQLVNEKISQLSVAGERQPLLTTVVLTGLALADDLLRMQSKFEAAVDNVSRRTSRLAPGIIDDLGSDEHAERNRLPAAHDDTDSIKN